jgi:hypothetical protein
MVLQQGNFELKTGGTGADMWVRKVATLNVKRVVQPSGRSWIELFGTTAQHEPFSIVLFDDGTRTLDAVAAAPIAAEAAE